MSHLCKICLALLKAQQFWKYHAFSVGKYPTAYRKHELIFIIRNRKKAFVPFMSDLSCFTERTAILKISRYFRRQISYCFQKLWTYFLLWNTVHETSFTPPPPPHPHPQKLAIEWPLTFELWPLTFELLSQKCP